MNSQLYETDDLAAAIDSVLDVGEDPVACFVATKRDSGHGVMVLGRPADVTLAHATLFLAGFDITPRPGELRGDGALSIFALTEEGSATLRSALDYLELAFDELRTARGIYHFDYS